LDHSAAAPFVAIGCRFTADGRNQMADYRKQARQAPTAQGIKRRHRSLDPHVGAVEKSLQ
jgi:hypothetical protein